MPSRKSAAVFHSNSNCILYGWPATKQVWECKLGQIITEDVWRGRYILLNANCKVQKIAADVQVAFYRPAALAWRGFWSTVSHVTNRGPVRHLIWGSIFYWRELFLLLWKEGAESQNVASWGWQSIASQPCESMGGMWHSWAGCNAGHQLWKACKIAWGGKETESTRVTNPSNARGRGSCHTGNVWARQNELSQTSYKVHSGVRLQNMHPFSAFPDEYCRGGRKEASQKSGFNCRISASLLLVWILSLWVVFFFWLFNT